MHGTRYTRRGRRRLAADDPKKLLGEVVTLMGQGVDHLKTLLTQLDDLGSDLISDLLRSIRRLEGLDSAKSLLDLAKSGSAAVFLVATEQAFFYGEDSSVKSLYDAVEGYVHEMRTFRLAQNPERFDHDELLNEVFPSIYQVLDLAEKFLDKGKPLFKGASSDIGNLAKGLYKNLNDSRKAFQQAQKKAEASAKAVKELSK